MARATPLFSEAVSGTNTTIQAGTGKLAEFRGFFPTGFYVNWQQIPIPSNGVEVNRFIAACNNVPTGTFATTAPGSTSSLRGTSWQMSLPYYANYQMYNHVGAPNSRSCSNIPVDQIGLDVYGSSAATSFHPNGVNVGMSDGSVRFMKETISLPTWWAVGTRNGNETINSNAL